MLKEQIKWISTFSGLGLVTFLLIGIYILRVSKGLSHLKSYKYRMRFACFFIVGGLALIFSYGIFDVIDEVIIAAMLTLQIALPIVIAIALAIIIIKIIIPREW